MKVLTHPSSPASPSWLSPTLRHQTLPGPRASPPIDVRQGHPLLHMQLEPWWFNSWELGAGGGESGWFILLFFLWVANPFSSFSSSSKSSIGNGWLQASASVFVRLWKSLSGDSYIRLLSASPCWYPQ
jgi:hypothetical protein